MFSDCSWLIELIHIYQLNDLPGTCHPFLAQKLFPCALYQYNKIKNL